MKNVYTVMIFLLVLRTKLDQLYLKNYHFQCMDIIKNGYGFINVILEGDTMSTLRAGFLTESNSNVTLQNKTLCTLSIRTKGT